MGWPRRLASKMLPEIGKRNHWGASGAPCQGGASMLLVQLTTRPIRSSFFGWGVVGWGVLLLVFCCCSWLLFFYSQDSDLLHAFDVIGTHETTLVDTRRHARRTRAGEDQVRCVVTPAVRCTLAERIVVAVRGARLGDDQRNWIHEAAGAAVTVANKDLLEPSKT